MAQASKDQNFVSTLLAVSSADGITPVKLYADPTSHRLLADLPAGAGTVTSVSVSTANGFAGTVATPTTTPTISIQTTVTGVLKGNGTAVSAALNSDLPVMTSTVGGAVPTPPNNTTTFLRGDGTFATPAGGGTVTSVSVVSANGFSGTVATPTTTPAITVQTSINAPVLAGNGTAISAATTTGTGATVVLQTSPTLITPALGTPSSGTLSNCVGLPISTGVSGLATGMATFLGTPSSANLAATVTDETGTGSLVFGSSPTITSPNLTGTATLPTCVLSQHSIQLPSSLSGTGTWSGISQLATANSTLAFGDVVYLNTSSKWDKAKGDSQTTSAGKIGICILAANPNAATEILTYGLVNSSGFPTLTVGSQVYLSSSTAGTLTMTQPSATDNVIRVIGTGNGSSELFLDPSPDFITHT